MFIFQFSCFSRSFCLRVQKVSTWTLFVAVVRVCVSFFLFFTSNFEVYFGRHDVEVAKVAKCVDAS